MIVHKERVRGIPKSMLRVRLRIKGIKGYSHTEHELIDKTRHVEPVDIMVQRLRLGYS